MSLNPLLATLGEINGECKLRYSITNASVKKNQNWKCTNAEPTARDVSAKASMCSQERHLTMELRSHLKKPTRMATLSSYGHNLDRLVTPTTSEQKTSCQVFKSSASATQECTISTTIIERDRRGETERTSMLLS